MVGQRPAGQFLGSVYALQVEFGVSLLPARQVCAVCLRPTGQLLGSVYGLQVKFVQPVYGYMSNSGLSAPYRSIFGVRLRSTGHFCFGCVYALQVNFWGLSAPCMSNMVSVYAVQVNFWGSVYALQINFWSV